MKGRFTDCYALGAKYPRIIEEEDYEVIRERFFKNFSISFLQQVNGNTIVVLVPVGKWDSVREFFRGSFCELIENLDIIVTDERT